MAVSLILYWWFEKLFFLDILILKWRFGDSVPGKHFVGFRKTDDSFSFKIDDLSEFGFFNKDDNLPVKKASLLPLCKKFISIFSFSEIKVAYIYFINFFNAVFNAKICYH